MANGKPLDVRTRIAAYQEFPEPPRDQVVQHTTRGGKGKVAQLTSRPSKRKAKGKR